MNKKNIMEQNIYNDIVKYKKQGIPPKARKDIWNFKTVADRYAINKKNKLTRGGKIVAKKSSLGRIWKSLHCNLYFCFCTYIILSEAKMECCFF